MIHGFENVQKTVQDNADLSMKNFGLMSQGFQAIATEAADYSKKSFEDGSAILEKMMTSKSLETAFQLQTDYAKSAYDSYVGEMTKLGTMMTELAQGMTKPYSAMFGAAGK